MSDFIRSGHSERPSAANTGAAVVTYHPDPSFPHRAQRIARRVNRVVVVDNHSHDAAIAGVRTQPGVDLIRNERNAGIAAALNQGVQWAKQRGYQWLLTLDQDTVAHDDIIETLASVYDQIADKDVIALIGSTSSTDAERRRTGVASAPSWIEAKSVITAGALMWLPASDAIGPFREELFIDLVDIEYCLRARRRGFKVFLCLKPSMDHQIGMTTTHRLPWKESGTSNHPAIRRYYMMRNHAMLAGEYLLKDPAWALTSLWSRVKSTILMCLFERDRIAKLKFTALGAWDGLIRNLSRNLSRDRER